MNWKRQRAGRVAALLVVAFVSVPAAAQLHGHPPTVAGKWTISVESGPHGAMTMALTLEQDGKAVSGTFASPHGEMSVAGEFADGTLTLKTKGDTQITFNATLKDDGTLAGYLSSEMGDMTWTGARVKDQNP